MIIILSVYVFLDDEADGWGGYWGGSIIVYVGWCRCTLSKEYAKTYSSRLGFWKVMYVFDFFLIKLTSPFFSESHCGWTIIGCTYVDLCFPCYIYRHNKYLNIKWLHV
jgi:hypothetical protein